MKSYVFRVALAHEDEGGDRYISAFLVSTSTLA